MQTTLLPIKDVAGQDILYKMFPKFGNMGTKGFECIPIFSEKRLAYCRTKSFVQERPTIDKVSIVSNAGFRVLA